MPASTPPSVRKIHWPLDDPAKAAGVEAEIMSVFRAAQDDIRDRVQSLIAELVEQTNRTEAEP